MSSARNAEYSETIEELKANFSVVYSIISSLKGGLSKDSFLTSYGFISKNITRTVSFIQDELELLLKHAGSFEETCLSSNLQLALYKGNPEVIFEYRDAVRDFADDTRRRVDSFYVNVGKTLAAYILLYETLEKFGIKVPFVFVESNEFLSQDLVEFIFGEFGALGSRIKHKPCSTQMITYSSLDISNPLSLLIVGHEAFHIVDRLDGVFSGFCKETGFKGDERSMEAFVDIMSCLYFGPVYTVAMQKYFQKRYPLSGESHPEMNIRLMILSYLQAEMGPSETMKAQTKSLNEFIRLLAKRMSKETAEKAKEDKVELDSMIKRGVIKYVKDYFRKKGVITYSAFVNVVEKREYDSGFEKLDRAKMRFMLKRGIPVAARPIALLNALNEKDTLEKIDPRLVVASVKKWYVKRYYQKSIEGQNERI